MAGKSQRKLNAWSQISSINKLRTKHLKATKNKALELQSTSSSLCPFSLRLIAISTSRLSPREQEEMLLSFNWLIKRAESKWWDYTKQSERENVFFLAFLTGKAKSPSCFHLHWHFLLKVNIILASLKLSNLNWQLFRFYSFSTKK